jgi:hypothetical protein
MSERVNVNTCAYQCKRKKRDTTKLANTITRVERSCTIIASLIPGYWVGFRTGTSSGITTLASTRNFVISLFFVRSLKLVEALIKKFGSIFHLFIIRESEVSSHCYRWLLIGFSNCCMFSSGFLRVSIDWLSVAYAAHNPTAHMPAVVKHYPTHHALPRVVTREPNTPRARHCKNEPLLIVMTYPFFCVFV